MAFQAIKAGFKAWKEASKIGQFTHRAGRTLGVRSYVQPLKETMNYIFKGHEEIPLGVLGRTVNKGDRLAEGWHKAYESARRFSTEIGTPYLDKIVRPAYKTLGDDGFKMAYKAAGAKHAYRQTNEYINWFNKLSPEQRIVATRFETGTRQFMDDIMLNLAKGNKVAGFQIPKAREWAAMVEAGNYMPRSISGQYSVLVPKNLNQIGGRTINADDIMTGLDNLYSTQSLRNAQRYILANNLQGKSFIHTGGFIPSSLQKSFGKENVAKYLENVILNNGAYLTEARGAEIKKIMLDDIMKGSKQGKIAILKAKLGSEEAYQALKEAGMTDAKMIKAYEAYSPYGKYTNRPFSPNELLRNPEIAEIQSRYAPEMLEQYVKSMPKKLLMNDAVRDWVGAMKHPAVLNTQGATGYMEHALEVGLGKPGFSAEWIAKHLAPLGVDQRHILKAMGTMMQAQAALKIGINPLILPVNATQVWINTHAVLGRAKAAPFGWVAKAYKLWNKPKYRELIQEAGLTMRVEGQDVPKILEGMRELGGSKFMDMVNHIVLYPFKAIEIKHNRALTYIAAYEKGITTKTMGGMGLDAIKAKEFASRIVDLTQFPYGSASQPFIFSDPLAKLAFQFKTYFLHQLFFMEKLGKYAIEGVRTGDVTKTYPFMRMLAGYGILGGTGSIPFTQYFRDRSAKLNELELKYPLIARGLPSLAGVDISYRLGLQFPTSKEKVFEFMLGPTYKTFYQAGKAGAEIAMYGRPGEQTRRFVGGLSPVGSFMRVKKDKQGWKTVDWNGKATIARFENRGSAVASMFGFRGKEAFQQSQIYQINKIYKQRLASYRKYYIDKITKLMIDGNRSQAMALLSGVNSQTVPRTPFKPDITIEQINRAIRDTNVNLSSKSRMGKKRREELRRHLLSHNVVMQ